MGERKVKQRLYDILECIEGARQTLGAVTFDEYYHNWTVRRAVERALEIISEASRHIPDDIKARDAATNWRQVANIGNHLRHEYHNITDRVIYDIAVDYLPALESFIQTQYDLLPEENE